MEGLQLSNLFRLGMRHIAEGTDHLLFLLVLLLPAPLLAGRPYWNGTVGVRKGLLRNAGIVTAFTVGHSLTLTLAAMNMLCAYPTSRNTHRFVNSGLGSSRVASTLSRKGGVESLLSSASFMALRSPQPSTVLGYRAGIALAKFWPSI